MTAAATRTAGSKTALDILVGTAAAVVAPASAEARPIVVRGSAALGLIAVALAVLSAILDAGRTRPSHAADPGRQALWQ